MKAVVYTLSKNLYPALKPSLESLLEHTKVDRIYLLIEDKTFPYQLPDICKVIDCSEVDLLKDSPNINTDFTIMCLLRLAYTKLLPKNLTKVLQLDIDTIITDDISELFEIDMADSYMMAAEELRGTWKPYGEKYYNVGVAMFNLKQIRKDKKDIDLINCINSTKLTYIDQDACNLVFKDRIKPMPQRYNECFVTENSDNPAIIHYAGIKQWWNPYHVHSGWQPDETTERRMLVLDYGLFE